MRTSFMAFVDALEDLDQKIEQLRARKSALFKQAKRENYDVDDLRETLRIRRRARDGQDASPFLVPVASEITA